MRPYFEKMPVFGRELNAGQIKSAEENVKQLREIEARLKTEAEKVKQAGFSEEKINARGQMTVWQRLNYLVDPGTWCSLHSLYNPEDNEEGTTNVVDGLGKISGRWAVIIGFDNKVLAGALAARTIRKYPAGHQPFQALEYPPGLAGPLQRGEIDGTGKVLRRSPRRRHHLFPSR
jgi:hypothetical protein